MVLLQKLTLVSLVVTLVSSSWRNFIWNIDSLNFFYCSWKELAKKEGLETIYSFFQAVAKNLPSMENGRNIVQDVSIFIFSHLFSVGWSAYLTKHIPPSFCLNCKAIIVPFFLFSRYACMWTCVLKAQRLKRKWNSTMSRIMSESEHLRETEQLQWLWFTITTWSYIFFLKHSSYLFMFKVRP